jgi:hypothetical protein
LLIFDSLIVIVAIAIILSLAFYSSSRLKLFTYLYLAYFSIDILTNNSESFQIFKFQPYDLFGIIVFIVLTIKIFRGHYGKYKNDLMFRVFLIAYITEIIIVIASIGEYGILTLKVHRTTLHGFNLLFVVIGYQANKYNIEYLLLCLRNIVIVTIVVYPFKLLGILDIYSAYQEVAFTVEYNKLRFLSNSQVLYLLLYFVFINTKARRGYYISKVEKLLSIIAIILIITSTQRMITLLFILYISYYFIIGVKHLNAKIFTKILFSVVTVLFISIFANTYIMRTISSSLENVAQKQSFKYSTAYYKIIDPFVSSSMIVKENKWLYGRLIQRTVFKREYMTFKSSENRFIHNTFAQSFVEGGLFKTIPLLLLWVLLIIKSIRYNKLDGGNLYSEIASIWMVILFMYNNTSGNPFMNALILGLSLLIQYDYKFNSNSISMNRSQKH